MTVRSISRNHTALLACAGLMTAGVCMAEAGREIPLDLRVAPVAAGKLSAQLGPKAPAWQQEFRHAGADYLTFHISSFDLGPGDRLVLTSLVDGSQTTLTAGGKTPRGSEFWTPAVEGDAAVLEYFAGARSRGGFMLAGYEPGVLEPVATSGGPRAVFNNCDNPGLAIPEAGDSANPSTLPGILVDDFVVTSLGTITDLNISLNITHTYVGDLVIIITHVDTGTSVVIMDRPGRTTSGYGCSNNNINATFDDADPDPVENECRSNTGGLATIRNVVKPQNPLSVFNGETLAGTWRIRIEDYADQDIGTLNQWCLLSNALVAGDIDDDGLVDLAEVNAAALAYRGVAPVLPCQDTDSSGTVSLTELNTIVANYRAS